MKKFRGAIQIDFHYSEYLGARYDKAGVSLHLATSDRYEFVTLPRVAVWQPRHRTRQFDIFGKAKFFWHPKQR